MYFTYSDGRYTIPLKKTTGRKKKMRAGFSREYSLIKSIKKKTFQRKGALSHLKTVKKIFIKKKRVKS